MHVYWLSPAPELTPWPGRWLLSAVEQARANRWLNPARRREFLWGRALLRYVVAQSGLPAEALQFHESGRPFLEGRGDISLAHTADHVVVGICQDGWLGVDVETHAPRDTTLMERFFHAHERAWMGEDISRLHRLWTLKESALKALGTGVSGNPARVWVEPDTGVTMVMDAPAPTAVWSWFEEQPGVTAALVHLARSVEMRHAPLTVHRVTPSDLAGWMASAQGRTQQGMLA